MMKVWKWLSGKKTVIGTILLMLSTIIKMTETDIHWLLITSSALDMLGLILGGVGLGHKYYKK